MSETMSLAASALFAAPIQPLGAPLTPADPPAAPAQGPVNINGPAYISPAISFDPATDVVFFTYRNSETGKVTEQIPPSSVSSRYQTVDDTGVPSPTPDATTATAARLSSSLPPAATPPQPAPAATGGSATASPPASKTIA
jgi:hypothetical protein